MSRPKRIVLGAAPHRRGSSLGVRVLLALLAAALLALGACKGATNESDFVAGTRLGMSPRDVRERFVPGGEGTWQTSLGSGDDTTLEWRASGSAANYQRARFEFHLGMLVAVRAHTAETTRAESVTVTPKVVTVVRPSGEGGTDIDILSRDCPTHHEEAESFATKAH